jgi:CRP/FNR family transcriptional regulator
MSKKTDYLSKFPFFHGLAVEDLDTVAGVMIEKKYPKNNVIFLEGEPGEAVFFIRQGRVKISKSTPDGREQILHMLKEGDIFAEVILFEQGTYPASAEAVENTVVYLLRNADMEALLQSQPLLAVKMLRLMGKRLRQAQLLIRDLALHDAYSRLAGLLLRFVRREGKETEDGTVIELELTRQEIASMIGTSRETVVRILSRFQKEGILTLDKQRVIILDKQQLRDWIY